MKKVSSWRPPYLTPKKVDGSTQRLRVRLFQDGERAVRFGAVGAVGGGCVFPTASAQESV